MQVSLEQLTEVFVTVFGPNTQITELTTKDDIEEWDSINHLNLVLELNNYFAVSLSIIEIEKIKTVKDIIEILKIK